LGTFGDVLNDGMDDGVVEPFGTPVPVGVPVCSVGLEGVPVPLGGAVLEAPFGVVTVEPGAPVFPVCSVGLVGVPVPLGGAVLEAPFGVVTVEPGAPVFPVVAVGLEGGPVPLEGAVLDEASTDWLVDALGVVVVTYSVTTV